MTLGGLQKLTLIDYPGRISCTIFLIGCNYHCPYCYNPELVLPEKIKDQPRISEREFFKFLKERKNFLEGVVICGGEPCINKDLPQFCKKIKKFGYAVKIDTNGSNPQMLKKLVKENLVDYLAVDIKAPKEKYYKLVGKSKKENVELIKNIEKCLAALREGGVDYELRTTVIPSLLNKQDVIKIARWISPAPKYFLQNFLPQKTIDPKFKKIKPYSQEYLLEIQRAIAPFFEICQTR